MRYQVFCFFLLFTLMKKHVKKKTTLMYRVTQKKKKIYAFESIIKQCIKYMQLL